MSAPVADRIAPPSREAWDSAFAAFVAASAAFDLVSDSLDDGLVDPASDAWSGAVNALIRTPAPDGPALLWKAEYLFADGDGICEEWVGAFMADAYRLLGGEAGQ